MYFIHFRLQKVVFFNGDADRLSLGTGSPVVVGRTSHGPASKQIEGGVVGLIITHLLAIGID